MSRRDGFVEYQIGQIPASAHYIHASNIQSNLSPAVSLRQSYGAPVYRETANLNGNPRISADDGDIQRIQEELRFRYWSKLLAYQRA